MQTIAAFAASAAHAVGSVAATAGHAVMTVGRAVAGAGQAGATISSGSKILQAIRIGTSAVSALSVYQQDRMKADAMEQTAADQEMQARQEFIQSQEQANEIGRQYNQLVEQQMMVAAASGIDINSGSVVEARQQAQAEADRQTSIGRNSTQLNAALRRSRALSLRANATSTREGGFIGGAVKAGEGYLDIRKAG